MKTFLILFISLILLEQSPDGGKEGNEIGKKIVPQIVKGAEANIGTIKLAGGAEANMSGSKPHGGHEV